MRRNNICIIPARGGSKRIPRKNVKDFLGKPIIAYSIQAAKESGLFSTIIVSTDDGEIAEVAKQYGAEVPFLRSKENSDDHATLSDVVEEIKEWYLSRSIEYDCICCLLATAPFVNAEFLKEAYSKLIKFNYDSVRPIVRFSYPIQRGLRFENDIVSYINPEFSKTRSQDLEPAYYDAGMFYWMQFKKGLQGENKSGIVIPEKIAQDIDTLEDWEIAEIKYKMIYKKKHKMKLQEIFLSKLNVISQIDQDYSLEALGHKHTDDVLSWRNDPKNLELFENTTLITRESQTKFIDNYKNLDRIDLVLNYKGEAIGVFNIKNLKEKPEYGSLIGNTDFRGRGLGTLIKKVIINYWFDVLDQKEIYVKIKNQNQFLIDSNLKLGFKQVDKEGELSVLRLTKSTK